MSRACLPVEDSVGRRNTPGRSELVCAAWTLRGEADGAREPPTLLRATRGYPNWD